MQQVYVNAFTHLHQFNGAARFSTWLTRMCHGRRQKAEGKTPSSVTFLEPAPPSQQLVDH